MFMCILVARDAKFNGDLGTLTCSRILLAVAVCFLVSQLLAAIRLFQFGGACVMDRTGFKHFSMGTLLWGSICGAEVIEVVGSDDDDWKFVLVLRLNSQAMQVITPSWINRLMLRCYARFKLDNSTIELFCEFLKIEPQDLLWHIHRRSNFGSK
jgi:hypothetical protein